MERPTSVTIFGILNIVFAAFGIVGVLATAMLFKTTGTDTANPVIKLIQSSPAYASWMEISIPLGLVTSGVLLTAGIGLLNLKPWARKLSVIYGVYAVVMILVTSVVNYFLMVQPMIAQARTEQGPQAAAAMGGAIGGAIGGCFGIIYPILLLIFMTRPNVVAAFNPPTPPDLPS